jgi:hypothetical protein
MTATHIVEKCSKSARDNECDQLIKIYPKFGADMARAFSHVMAD